MTTPQRQAEPSRRLAFAVGILLFGLVLWAFLPSLRNGFIDYDDAPFVTANPQVQAGMTWQGIGYAFRTPVAANWHPLTTLSHMLDCAVFGLKPWGHHLTNVLLHALNTVLLFLLFRRMTGSLWRCVFLALLFALHPLRVESVAWISERKDVLSTLFWMLTLLAYVRYAEDRRMNAECTMQKPESGSQAPTSRFTFHASRFYLLSLCLFVLGLMSKPMLVTLPVVLLLLDYWPLDRFQPKTQDSRLKTLLPLLREKLPFFALAIAAAVVALAVQAGAQNVKTTGQYVLAARLQNALVSYCRYLGKLFWPTDLSPFYPYPAEWAWSTVLLCGLALVVISLLAVALGRRHRCLAVGWFWFVVTLIPVIGLVQIGHQSIADHYTYIPGIGVLLLLIWGAHELTARGPGRTPALFLLALAAALACTALTRRQIGHWKDDETLWQHALAVTGTNNLATYNLSVAWYNQGLDHAAQGEYDEAIRHYEKAIRLSPAQDDAHRGLAFALLKRGQLAEAIREYELALRLNPANAEAHNNLGFILPRQGRHQDAIQHLTEAIRLKPDYPEAHDNLGAILAGQGRYSEAAEHFRQLVRLKPGDPIAHRKLGRLLLEAGQIDEAEPQLAEAARLEPRSPESQYQLGVVLARKGETEKAANQFELVLRLNPNFAPAHYGLGILCQHRGRVSDALNHWREAVRLAPQWPDPLNNLAWTLATDPTAGVRNGGEAVKLAEEAVRLSGTNNAGMLDTLAAAYAEAGRFADASVTARRAQATAVARGQQSLAAQIGQRLSRYGANQPYRQDPAVKQSATSAP